MVQCEQSFALYLLGHMMFAEESQRILVIIVTSAINKGASNDPSPWSGEKPKYLSMKSMQLRSPKASQIH
jgi:hypothetical protein